MGFKTQLLSIPLDPQVEDALRRAPLPTNKLPTGGVHGSVLKQDETTFSRLIKKNKKKRKADFKVMME